jgi:hypothetical protein
MAKQTQGTIGNAIGGLGFGPQKPEIVEGGGILDDMNINITNNNGGGGCGCTNGCSTPTRISETFTATLGQQNFPFAELYDTNYPPYVYLNGQIVTYSIENGLLTINASPLDGDNVEIKYYMLGCAPITAIGQTPTPTTQTIPFQEEFILNFGDITDLGSGIQKTSFSISHIPVSWIGIYVYFNGVKIDKGIYNSGTNTMSNGNFDLVNIVDQNFDFIWDSISGGYALDVTDKIMFEYDYTI